MQYEIGYSKTLYEMLKQSRDSFGNRILFSYYRAGEIIEVSHNEFFSDVCKVASGFAKHGLYGKHIVVEGNNEYEAIVAMCAAATMGAIPAVINFDLPKNEIEYALEKLRPAAIACCEDDYEVVEEYVINNKVFCVYWVEIKENESIHKWIRENEEVDVHTENQKPEDPALVLMTSGSTSRSKLVQLSHYGYIPTLELYAEKDMLLFPLYHVAGTMMVVNAISKGVNLCLSCLKNGLRDAEWFQPEEIVAVPAFISAMVSRNKQGLFDLSGIKYVTSAGAPQNPELTQYLNALGIFSPSVYGATETSGPVSYSTETEYKFGSIGKVGPWNEVKISETGEIMVKGKNVMLEYLGDMDATQEALADGWYHTGDVGYLDEDGFLHITGRRKNIIILSNGENVSPEAIEAQLNLCSDILEVVVYGIEDVLEGHVWCGETIDGQTKKNVEQYIAKYNRSVPSYRAIRRTVFRDKPFNKTASGKIKR